MTQRSKVKTRRPLRVLLNSILTIRRPLRVLGTTRGNLAYASRQGKEKNPGFIELANLGYVRFSDH